MDAYVKVRMVGRGAHGIVYLCRRLVDGADSEQFVIIKQIPLDCSNLQERQNVLGEVRMLQMLSHPNIIGYFDNFLEDNAICIVMQYAEGGTLADMISERNGCLMDEEKILFYFVQVVLSLHYIHGKQILHRDLKTQNILLNQSRKMCKLSDFGISKHLMTHSKASSVIGTPSYLSPEICEGRSYNQKSDMWSLGCVLYELITLRRAFDAETLPALVMKITKGRYAPIGDHVSEKMRQLVESLLDLNENRRPSIRQVVGNPLVLGPLLRIMTDLGALSIPRPLYTPSSSHKLRTSFSQDSRVFGAHLSPRAKQRLQQKVLLWSAHSDAPQALPFAAGSVSIRQVACNGCQVFAVTDSGRLIIWEPDDEETELESASGSAPLSDVAQLHMRYLHTPQPMHLAQVVCGTDVNCFITNQGVLLTGGSGASGCLGHGSRADVANPKIVERLVATSVVQVACGGGHVMALTSDNQLFGWGDPSRGRLSMKSDGLLLLPTEIEVDSDVSWHSVDCCGESTALVDSTGAVWTTGDNRGNKLAVATTGERAWQPTLAVSAALPPVDMSQPQPFSLGLNHMALISAGNVFVTGQAGGELTRRIDLPPDALPRRVSAAPHSTVIVTSRQTVVCVPTDAAEGAREPRVLLDDVGKESHTRDIISLDTALSQTLLCLRV